MLSLGLYLFPYKSPIDILNIKQPMKRVNCFGKQLGNKNREITNQIIVFIIK